MQLCKRLHFLKILKKSRFSFTLFFKFFAPKTNILTLILEILLKHPFQAVIDLGEPNQTKKTLELELSINRILITRAAQKRVLQSFHCGQGEAESNDFAEGHGDFRCT